MVPPPASVPFRRPRFTDTRDAKPYMGRHPLWDAADARVSQQPRNALRATLGLRRS
jgi:hypothetical protein